MAHLFILENNIAKPNVETLLISPFKEIWERDTTPHKEEAIKDFTYIELMSSKRKSNPYAEYIDDKRREKLIEMLKRPSDWKEDELIKNALVAIDDIQREGSFNYTMYKQSLDTLIKTREYLLNIDLNERNKSGMPVYKPSEVYASLEKVEKLMISMNNLKEKVDQDWFDSNKVRGSKVINPLEI